MAEPLLEVSDLRIHFFTDEGVVKAVDGVDLTIERGKTLCLVGESGCGKSVTSRAFMQIVRKPGKIVSGEILLHRTGPNNQEEVIDLAKLDPKGELIRDIRGKEIAMIFQEPMTSLSPMHTIGEQIVEAIMLHQNIDRAGAEERAAEALTAVRIGNAREFMRSYPHQYSGGMRQRAMIAMALSCNPQVLIADEPTTALDVTIQAQILDLMRRLQQEYDSAIIMITHNLGIINEMADRVAVMYLGKIVEIADRKTLFKRPAHPYTVGLMQSVPTMGDQQQTRLHPIPGMIPDPFNIPRGCAFHPRCPVKNKPAACTEETGVPLIEVEPGHWVRCTLYRDLANGNH